MAKKNFFKTTSKVVGTLAMVLVLVFGLVLVGCGDAESGPSGTPGGGDTYGVSLKNGSNALTAHTFTDTTALNVTVSNTGNKATGALTVAKSGTNAASFTVSKTSISDIAVDGTDSFTVSPNTGLAVGSYTATVTVSGGNSISASFTVSYTVSAPPVTKTDFIGTWKTGGSSTEFLVIADTTLTWKYTNTDGTTVFYQADVTGLTWGAVTKDTTPGYFVDRYKVTVTGASCTRTTGTWDRYNPDSDEQTIFPASGNFTLTLLLVVNEGGSNNLWGYQNADLTGAVLQSASGNSYTQQD